MLTPPKVPFMSLLFSQTLLSPLKEWLSWRVSSTIRPQVAICKSSSEQADLSEALRKVHSAQTTQSDPVVLHSWCSLALPCPLVRQ